MRRAIPVLVRKFIPAPRRLLRLLVLAIGLDLTLCGIASAAGEYELLAAQQDVRGASTTQLLAQAPALRTRVDVAATAFGLARLCWWPWRPVAAAVSAIPPLRAVGSVGPLLDLSADGSMAGAHALDGALPLATALGRSHKTGVRGETGVRLLAGLARGHDALRSARDSLLSAERDSKVIDVAALPRPLRTRLASLPRTLASADDGLRAALAAPDLLGAAGPRTYLIVPENPWDLRATGGFVGTAVLLEADHGRSTLLPAMSSDAVDTGRPDYVPPPLPLLTYEHFGNWYYRDANWSPDFPTSAALMRYFYWLGRAHAPGASPLDRRAPDGVVAFDSALLPPLLTLTGPIVVKRSAGPPVPLTATNAMTTIDTYVNGTANGIPDKAFAKEAYGAVFHSLQNLPVATLAHAASVIGTALRQRHLLVWLPNSGLGPILARHGWDGAIDPARTDYLYVVDTNVHYNKINQLVHEGLTYRGVVQPDSSLRATLTITYTNTATMHNLPAQQNNTLYEDFVRVYTPLGSRLFDVSGLTQFWKTEQEHNKTVFSGYLRLPSRASTTVRFSYLVPPNALLDPTTYHLAVQKQPGAAAVPLSVGVTTAAAGMRVGGGTAWGWQGTLDGDVTLTAPLSGGHPAPVPLAYDASPVIVAPGARIDPWTVLPDTLPTMR